MTKTITYKQWSASLKKWARAHDKFKAESERHAKVHDAYEKALDEARKNK